MNRQLIYDNFLTYDGIDAGSVALVVTSPPYNVGKSYEKGMSYQEWYELVSLAIAKCSDLLLKGGRIAVNIGNTGRRPYRSLSHDVIDMIIDAGLDLAGEVIWDKTAAIMGCGWGSWRSASAPFLRDQTERIVIGCKGYKRSDKGTSTISAEDFMKCSSDLWRMRPESAKRIKHPAPFPIELPRRLIEFYTYKDDVVLDPFMGSGTTGIAAAMTSRKFVGVDICSDYVKLAAERLSAFDDRGDE